MDQPVVGPGPDQPLHARRLGQSENGSVVLGRGLVERDRPTGRPERLGIVPREVGRDDRPALPFVHRLEQHVAAVVEHVRVVRRDEERRRPLEAVLPFRGCMTVRAVRPRVDQPEAVGLVIHPAQEARVVTAVGDVGIVGACLDVARLARHVVPLAAIDPNRPAARPAHARVVLLRAAHAVREVIRRLDVVELSGRDVLIGPRLATVERDVRATVVRFDQPLGIVGSDPEVVVVTVRVDHVLERDATVRRLVEVGVHRPHAIRVLGVGEDLHVVPGSLAELVIRAHVLPRRAAVVRAVHAARVGLDERPHPGRLRGRHGDPDVAPQTRRKPGILGQLGPVLAAVRGLEHPAPRAAGHERPGPAHRLPQPGVEHVGARGVEDQVRRAGRVVPEEDLVPRLPAIGGLVDAALGIGPKGVSLCRDVHDVRVGGMDPHARDLLGLGQAEERPGLAAIGGLPHAVPVGDVAADRELARADVHDVRIRLGDADGADSAAEILVGHRQPRVAAVDALEDAAAGGAEPVLLRTRRGARDRDAPTPAENADLAPGEGGKHAGVVGSGGLGLRLRGTGREEQQSDGGEGRQTSGHGRSISWSGVGGESHVSTQTPNLARASTWNADVRVWSSSAFRTASP